LIPFENFGVKGADKLTAGITAVDHDSAPVWITGSYVIGYFKPLFLSCQQEKGELREFGKKWD